jgi:hypothetical protein
MQQNKSATNRLPCSTSPQERTTTGTAQSGAYHNGSQLAMQTTEQDHRKGRKGLANSDLGNASGIGGGARGGPGKSGPNPGAHGLRASREIR